MALRLDPTIARVWASPTTLRFGAERPRLILSDVRHYEELLIHALRIGTNRQALVMLGAEVGADELQVDRLIARLSPVLATETETEAESLLVAVERVLPWPDCDSAVDRSVHGVIARSGMTMVTRDEDPDLAVVLQTHLVAPTTAQYWLARDIPMLPLVLGEESITVGPLVLPGSTCCMNCLHQHLTDEDPAWPMIAGQLLDPELASAVRVDAVVAAEATALTGRAVDRLAAGRASGMEGVSARVALDGTVSRRTWAAHPRCSCRARQGSGTANVVPIGAARAAPTTSAASPALA